MIETIDARVPQRPSRGRNYDENNQSGNLLWASLVVCLAIGFASLNYGLKYEKSIRCDGTETCSPECIATDIASLTQSLNKLSEKHLIPVQNLNQAFQGFFMRTEVSNKPLSIGLVGDDADIREVINCIVQSLYRKAEKSLYVHRYLEVTEKLMLSLREQVKTCPRSIFIFDSFDKRTSSEYSRMVDFFKTLNSLFHFRESIFIFIFEYNEKYPIINATNQTFIDHLIVFNASKTDDSENKEL